MENLNSLLDKAAASQAAATAARGVATDLLVQLPDDKKEPSVPTRIMKLGTLSNGTEDRHFSTDLQCEAHRRGTFQLPARCVQR